MCGLALTSGQDEVAVEFSDNEGLGETPQVLLEQAGNVVRVHVSFQLHTLTSIKTITELQGGRV